VEAGVIPIMMVVMTSNYKQVFIVEVSFVNVKITYQPISIVL